MEEEDFENGTMLFHVVPNPYEKEREYFSGIIVIPEKYEEILFPKHEFPVNIPCGEYPLSVLLQWQSWKKEQEQKKQDHQTQLHMEEGERQQRKVGAWIHKPDTLLAGGRVFHLDEENVRWFFRDHLDLNPFVFRLSYNLILGEYEVVKQWKFPSADGSRTLYLLRRR